MHKSLKTLRGASLLAASVLLASACGDSGTDERADLQDQTRTPTLESDQSTMSSRDSDLPRDPGMEERQASSDSMYGSDSDSGAGAGSMAGSSSDSGFGSDSDSMSGSMTGSMSDSSAEGEAGVSVDEDGVAQVRIGGTDAMQFTLRQFEVEAGQTVELTLTHEGRLGVEVMGHNIVFLKPGNDPVEFGARVMEEGGNADNEYLPDALRSDVVASTDMIGGGETTTITFTAPDEPGRYPFVSTFPGHYAAMNGVMTVI